MGTPSPKVAPHQREETGSSASHRCPSRTQTCFLMLCWGLLPTTMPKSPSSTCVCSFCRILLSLEANRFTTCFANLVGGRISARVKKRCGGTMVPSILVPWASHPWNHTESSRTTWEFRLRGGEIDAVSTDGCGTNGEGGSCSGVPCVLCLWLRDQSDLCKEKFGNQSKALILDFAYLRVPNCGHQVLACAAAQEIIDGIITNIQSSSMTKKVIVV